MDIASKKNDGVVCGFVRKGEYYDSVSLMIISKKIKDREGDGIIDSSVVMATKDNILNLKQAGLYLAKFESAEESDLVVAIRVQEESGDSGDSGDLLKTIELEIKNLNKKDDTKNDGLASVCGGSVDVNLMNANLALISVNGRYAGDLALKALNNNTHVMLFSDNVPLETEVELKQLARKKKLLVMGPDCGTAIIAGVPLAFANEVRRGSIGVVGASGTGMQEVTTLISNFGGGISHAIGTGGRDIKKEVGGISFLMALQMFKDDPQTKVILLISKPPHKEVMNKIVKEVDGAKRVVAVFLGAENSSSSRGGIIFRDNLYEGALTAYKISCGKGENIDEEMKRVDDSAEAIARGERKKIKNNNVGRYPKYLRGLYSGGTFVSEAQLVLDFEKEEMFSNVPTHKSSKLEDAKISCKNTIVDLGEDEFTMGKPHPMIDYSLRNERLLKEILDPEVAVIMLDYVLGYGAHQDPMSDTISILKRAKDLLAKEKRYISILATVTGTNKDPQNSDLVKEALKAAGVIVTDSNYQMSLIAKKIING
ncbi:MAG: acyl-CoA synthetase FdrA [Oligoflexia bacterium]|nr:acyl-CoA synthetase FdrA [Oligoflexia bacterium]